MPIFSLGYLIAERGICSGWRPDKEYRGVERLPSPPMSNSTMKDTTMPVSPAWQLFWDAFYEKRLEADVETSRHVIAELRRENFAVELIEAFVFPMTDLLPDRGILEEELAPVSERIGDIARRDGFVGFDVSKPLPTFESLLQFDPGSLDAQSRLLNNCGLFDALDDAMNNARAGTARFTPTLPYLPIAVVVVS